MTFVRIHGEDLHFDDIPAPDGSPVIVWGHGFLLAAESYADVAGRLPGFRHIIADLRGHGRSAHAEGDPTLSRMADDVWELTQTLGIDRFLYVGHSMGNAVGVRLVARHPDAILAAVSIGGIPVTGKHADARGDVAGMVDLAGDPSALAAALAGLYVHESPDSPGVARSGELGALVPKTCVAQIVREEFFLDDSAQLLPYLTQPWLFIVPSEDGAEPPEYQRSQAELFPDRHIVVLEGEGHMVPQEAPAVVASAIAEFLGADHTSRS